MGYSFWRYKQKEEGRMKALEAELTELRGKVALSGAVSTAAALAAPAAAAAAAPAAAAGTAAPPSLLPSVVQGADQLMNIAAIFGIDRKAIGQTVVKSMMRGQLDLNSLFGVTSEKKQKQRLLDKMYELGWLFMFLMVLVWTNIFIALWMGVIKV